MQLSPTPDLGPWRRMALAALAATVVAIASLVFTYLSKDPLGLVHAMGDTDDAMRVVMMRMLEAGHGWFDQKIVRLQPPMGVYMHWSRLIDGGLAALDGLFRLFVSPDLAELATRFTWPLLWVAPVSLAGLMVARRMGGGTAVFCCALLLATDMPLFLQYRPGRVDHHNVQIALCILSLAGAALGNVRGAVLAGAATGLGMAIGLEALVFEALIGAWFAIRYLLGEAAEVRQLRAYAVSLGLATAGFFLVQTPPSRWGVAACDAIGFNLAAGVVVAGAALTAAVGLTARRDFRWRLAALALAGAATLAVYVGLDPNCLHGPFADVDPQLKTWWLPNVQEIRPVPRVWLRDHATVLNLLSPMALGMVAWIWLAFSEARRREGFLWLAGILLLAGSVAGWNAVRLAGYAEWFAVPVIAVAVADVVDRFARKALLLAAVGALAVTPMYVGAVAVAADKQVKALTAKPKPKAPTKPAAAAKPLAGEVRGAAGAAAKPLARPVAKAPPGDPCFQKAAYAGLAGQPGGIVLTEIDLGPFILAHTPSSSLTAPYHRMNWGLIEARKAMSAPADKAQAAALALHAAYVLECPRHRGNADRVGMGEASLQKRLDAGKPPAWLEPLPSTGALKLYRVRPSAPAPGPAASAKP